MVFREWSPPRDRGEVFAGGGEHGGGVVDCDAVALSARRAATIRSAAVASSPACLAFCVAMRCLEVSSPSRVSSVRSRRAAVGRAALRYARRCPRPLALSDLGVLGDLFEESVDGGLGLR